MNEQHAALCSSAEWATQLHDNVLAPLLDGVDLGHDLLEMGPGPGAATSFLAPRVRRLVALEIDEAAATRLATTYQDTHVSVLVGDCTATGQPDASFDSVAIFTMLHHLPTQALQIAALSEAWRVLRPGGVLVGADSLPSDELHHFHADDTYNPVDPARLLVWLQTIGFRPISLTVDRRAAFRAHRPHTG